MDSPHLANGPSALGKFGRDGVLWFAMLACLLIAPPVAAFADEPIAQLDAGKARVAAVGYRLAVANRALCDEDLVPQTGFMVRSDATHGMTVTAVVPGSPAEAAGLTTGDHLRSINGLRLPVSASVERTVEALDRELRAGQVTLQVAGRDGVRELQFAAERGCSARVALIEDEAVNAWADGTDIRITTGLLARCKSDDDLALVLGHEMAHNLLRHRQSLIDTVESARTLLPEGEAASRQLHQTEEAADRLAVSLAMVARYDLTGAVAFMEGLLDRSIADSETHPRPDRRLALLREAIAEARQITDLAAMPSA